MPQNYKFHPVSSQSKYCRLIGDAKSPEGMTKIELCMTSDGLAACPGCCPASRRMFAGIGSSPWPRPMSRISGWWWVSDMFVCICGMIVCVTEWKLLQGWWHDVWKVASCLIVSLNRATVTTDPPMDLSIYLMYGAQPKTQLRKSINCRVFIPIWNPFLHLITVQSVAYQLQGIQKEKEESCKVLQFQTEEMKQDSNRWVPVANLSLLVLYKNYNYCVLFWPR